ncbi:MAG: hypothetical protein QOE22_166 [Candidatus Parcubacteria bacterium]|jgi:hypothetical protein|nr:hypothetical protein [Candidatus Parcubacteria bacterium]
MEAELNPAARPNNSWGAMISILLILAIVVAGAYYAFTDRVSPTSTTTVETNASY